MPNDRFEESDGFLNLALLGLLSLAPDRSKAAKLRKSVRELSLGVADVPKLAGFTSLRSLSLFTDGDGKNRKLKATDLSRFGGLPKLQTL